MSEIAFRFIAEAESRALRSAFLRPGLPLSAYPPVEAIHGGAFAGPDLIGSAGLLRQDLAENGLTEGWRLRGMITHPDWRSRGIGAQILGFISAEAVRRGARHIWCHGRTAALDFYRRQGFIAVGAEFMVAHTGPHFVMLRTYAG